MIINALPGGSGTGGGGTSIPLAACTDIVSKPGDKKVKIKWSDSKDTIINDVVVTKWEGTVLVRKEESYPQDEKDGTVVVRNTIRDQYKDKWYEDTNLANGTKYYYKLFPYSGKNYTDNHADEFTVTPQEIPLKAITVAKLSPDDQKIVITWTDPDDVSETDNLDGATWQKTVVVRKTVSQPTSPEDGTIVVTSTKKNQYQTEGYEDTGLVNDTVYYYAFYSYTTAGTVSMAYVLNQSPGHLPPNPCTLLKAKVGTKKVSLTWTDPDKVRNEDGKVATWAGTKLVRNDDHIPATWSDGEMVKDSTTWNQYQSSGYLDSGLTNGTTYHYAVFPYSTDGAYGDKITVDAVPKDIVLDSATALSAEAKSKKVTIKWMDPADKSETDTELAATWAGTKLVRKTSSAPESVSDGTTVVTSTQRNEYQTSGYVDSSLVNGTEYFYGVFPYTSDDVYSKAATTSATPTAPQPKPCTNIAAKPGNAQATITWTDPMQSDTIDGDSVTWAGTKLVRKEGKAPTTWQDGTMVKDSTTWNQYKTNGYVDTGIENDTEYYYAVFAYSTDNVYSTGISINVTPVERKPFNEYTWAELAQLADDIVAGTKEESLLELHETKDIILSGDYNETITVEVAGFKHDDKTDGKKAGITVIMKNLMKDTKRMNSSSTNVGGYGATEMHTVTLENIYNSLPPDLKPYIRTVKKPTSKGNESSEVENVACKLWLLSENELFGEKHYSTGNEGTKYPVFTDNTSRVKKLSNGTGNANRYWQRSPRVGITNAFCLVSDDGGYSSYGASNAGGICFGFCLGMPSSPKSTLSSNSWTDIAEASAGGTAKTTWNTGDTIDITLTGKYAQTLTLEILDFDHDDLLNGKKAGITFGCKNLMKDTKRMNSSNTNVGGYGATEMHTATLPEILDCFPEDLKSLIKTVNKKTSKGNKSTETEDIPCKLFLLSENELFGEKYYSTGNEGTKYPVFTDNTSRVKKLSNGTGNANWYWQRSPLVDNTYTFCYVYSDGNYDYNGASLTSGVAFGFCI